MGLMVGNAKKNMLEAGKQRDDRDISGWLNRRHQRQNIGRRENNHLKINQINQIRC